MEKRRGHIQEEYDLVMANGDAKEEALRRGYFVLQRSGDLVHTESSDHLTVL